MKTDELIQNLTEQAKPVKPMKIGIYLLVWLVFSIVTMVAMMFVTGPRMDAHVHLENVNFYIEGILAVLMAGSGLYAAGLLFMPDVGQKKKAVWLPFLPLSAFAGLAIFSLITEPVSSQEMQWNITCFGDIATLVIPSLVLLFFMVVRASCTHWHLLCMTASLGVGGLAYIISRMMCSEDSLGHVIWFHFVPALVISYVVTCIGQFLVRKRCC